MSAEYPRNWNPILAYAALGVLVILLLLAAPVLCAIGQPYPAAPAPASIAPTASQAGPVYVITPRHPFIRRTLGMRPAFTASPLYQLKYQQVTVPVWSPVTGGVQ